jgi:hypothetical protein
VDYRCQIPLIYFIYLAWRPAWIETHWNNIWLRAQSHTTSHYTWGSVTTLHDFGGVYVGTAFGHFLLGSHNVMVTALGSCVKWPLVTESIFTYFFREGSEHLWQPLQARKVTRALWFCEFERNLGASCSAFVLTRQDGVTTVLYATSSHMGEGERIWFHIITSSKTLFKFTWTRLLNILCFHHPLTHMMDSGAIHVGCWIAQQILRFLLK